MHWICEIKRRGVITSRVTEMTITLARMAGMTDAEILHLKRGALLHDIGKMGIPDVILLKDDYLTNEEWEIMRKHPEYAYEMLFPIEYLRPALDIPYCHHERWDGTGYPRGLAGEQIPSQRGSLRWWMYGMLFVLIVPIARAGWRIKFSNISAHNLGPISIRKQWNSFSASWMK